MVIVGTPPQASEHYPPPPPESRGCTQSFHLAFPGGPADGGFPASTDGGQVATEALSWVFA